MIGESSGIAPDRGLNILYRVTSNSLMNLVDTGLTATNTCYNPTASDVRITSDTPNGILAGMVLECGSTNGTVQKFDATGEPVGIAINNAVGYPYESMSGVGSGKVPYIHGSGTVFSTDLYEVYTSGSVSQVYTAGDKLYSSVNGLITRESGLGSGVQIGICVIAPSSTDPFMAVQLIR